MRRPKFLVPRRLINFPSSTRWLELSVLFWQGTSMRSRSYRFRGEAGHTTHKHQKSFAISFFLKMKKKIKLRTEMIPVIAIKRGVEYEFVVLGATLDVGDEAVCCSSGVPPTLSIRPICLSINSMTSLSTSNTALPFCQIYCNCGISML